MKPWAKILMTIVIMGVGLVGGFIGIIMITFSSFASQFYINLFAIAVLVMVLFATMQIWGLFKPKTRYISVGVACGVMVLSIVGVEINKAYVNSVGTVGSSGTDLTLYEPFKENTKAVSLNEPSTLKITDNLPNIDGATAIYPLYSAFARAVYPENNYSVYDAKKEEQTVVCTNTDGAYRRLIDGETDIIFVAGPSKEQLEMAKYYNVELKLTPIGREAFVFFVNAKNPINELTINDIQKIYSGESKNWSEFGGKNNNIRAFQRPENSGSQTTLIKFMGDIPLMTPPTEDVAGGMGDILKEVSPQILLYNWNTKLVFNIFNHFVLIAFRNRF